MRIRLTIDPRSGLPPFRWRVVRGTRERYRDLRAMPTSAPVSTPRRFDHLICATLCTLSFSIFSDAHADGSRMTELCNRTHRDLISMYVEGALDNAASDTTAIMSDLEKALQEGSSEIAGLKQSWKLVMSYCPPTRFTADQAADIFCDFLTLNPQKRRRDAIALLNEALQNAWPCSSGQKK